MFQTTRSVLPRTHLLAPSSKFATSRTLLTASSSSVRTSLRPASVSILSSKRLHATDPTTNFHRNISIKLSEFPRDIPPSAAMESYTKHFPNESSALTQLDFDGETRVWVLTFLGKDTPDNRLSHNFIDNGLLPALAHVEEKWDSMVNNSQNDLGAALITTGGTDPAAKIYSNGLDLEKAIADPHFFDRQLNNLYEKLMTFPIPTIAALNGHAFAGGFGLACAHDYRVMNSKRGYLCMNEIDFGAPLPHGLQMALASKISDTHTMRKIVLEGHRFSATEAKQYNIVDATAEGPKDTLDKAKQLADQIKIKAKMNVWGANKEVIYHPYIKVLRTTHEQSEELLHAARAKM